MYKVIRLVLFVLTSWTLVSGALLLNPIKGKFSGMLTDARGYIYAWTGEELKLWDISGKELYSFSSKASGKIASVDVKGGQRILIFYKESQRMMTLDNTLSPIGDVIDLRSRGFTDPQVCCLSGEAGFWVYDGGRDQLIRSGFDGKELASSPLLSVVREERTPVKLVERDQLVMMIMENGDAQLFDHFGTPVKRVVSEKNRRTLDLSDGVIYSTNQRGDSLFWKDISTLQEGAAVLPADSIVAFSLHDEKLLLLEPRAIGIYPKK